MLSTFHEAAPRSPRQIAPITQKNTVNCAAHPEPWRIMLTIPRPVDQEMPSKVEIAKVKRTEWQPAQGPSDPPVPIGVRTTIAR
jgi:hypothetical protein